jgi:hypothetical protein
VIDGDPSGDQIHFLGMRRTRFILTFLAFMILLFAFAPGAFAAVKENGGQGWGGETNDGQITNIMFATIAFFPTVIVLVSLLEWRLEKRKHARAGAVRAREKSADWRGGW